MSGDELDQDRVAFFAQQYAGMHDEELATLSFARGAALVDEARFALDREMARRDPVALNDAMASRAADVRARIAAAAAVDRQPKEADAGGRRLVWVLGCLGVLAGVVMGLLGSPENFAVALLGTSFVAFFEGKWLVTSVVRAIYRNADRSD